jgi:nucleotide-binding universal stress UspA family protein
VRLQFRHILFPTDFSSRCVGIVPAIRGFAQKYGSVVSLLSVLEEPQVLYDVSWTDTEVKSFFGSFYEVVSSKLEEFRNTYFADLPTQCEVREGGTAESILEYAATHEVDLIMMPTRGRGSLSSLFLGSVTAKVLHQAECPVWTGIERANNGSTFPYTEMVCSVAADESSIRALRFAESIREDFDASLILVHAFPTYAGTVEEQYEQPMREWAERKIRRQIGVLQEKADTYIPLCIAGGEPEMVIAETVRRMHANLVIAGRGHSHNFLGRFRSHIYPIVNCAPCPVLVF